MLCIQVLAELCYRLNTRFVKLAYSILVREIMMTKQLREEIGAIVNHPKWKIPSKMLVKFNFI